MLHLCFLASGKPSFLTLIRYLLEKYEDRKVLQRLPREAGLRRTASGKPAEGKATEGETFELVPFVDAAYTAQPYYVRAPQGRPRPDPCNPLIRG